jgi:hypothetical protein
MSFSPFTTLARLCRGVWQSNLPGKGRHSGKHLKYLARFYGFGSAEVNLFERVGIKLWRGGMQEIRVNSVLSAFGEICVPGIKRTSEE